MCPLKCGNSLTWDFSFLASSGLRAQSHWLFATVKVKGRRSLRPKTSSLAFFHMKLDCSHLCSYTPLGVCVSQLMSAQEEWLLPHGCLYTGVYHFQMFCYIEKICQKSKQQEALCTCLSPPSLPYYFEMKVRPGLAAYTYNPALEKLKKEDLSLMLAWATA